MQLELYVIHLEMIASSHRRLAVVGDLVEDSVTILIRLLESHIAILEFFDLLCSTVRPLGMLP